MQRTWNKVYLLLKLKICYKNLALWSNILYIIFNYHIFCYVFLGWIWEVGLHLFRYQEFVNRGILHGPWLPIYGSGSILILILLKKFRKKSLLILSAMLVCGVVEYGASYVLERMHNGVRWWDYSDYFLNLHGRICAEGLLCFWFGKLVYCLFSCSLHW